MKKKCVCCEQIALFQIKVQPFFYKNVHYFKKKCVCCEQIAPFFSKSLNFRWKNMNYFMKIYFSIEIYAESRGPDPHSFHTNELLSRQTLFPIGLLSKKWGSWFIYLDYLISRIPHQSLTGRLAKTQLSAKILHSIFCFSRTWGI